MNFIDNKDNCHVWILAPFLETEDENLKYYYDYTQSIAEYERVFAEIGCSWTWVNVTMDNFEDVIQTIKTQLIKTNIVLNLCDGDEINGTPGIGVIKELNKNNLIYTGSDAYFYEITTSKIPMKIAFDKHNILTPKWQIIKENKRLNNALNSELNSELNTHFNNEFNASKIFEETGDLLIVKPAVSGGSMGLTLKNVVDTEGSLLAAIEEIKKGYHGWKLDLDGIFVEQFIKGREFTTFLVGSHTDPDNIIFYPPVERVFHASLPEKEQFLSFDRLWETYDEETAMPENGFLYEYAEPEKGLLDALKDISIRAYQSVGGTGYGRIDIRMNNQTNALFVLEVNAQSGISEDENYTSIGAILRFANTSFTQLIIEIIQDALRRHKQ
jgi:D-alanine-D-alanine ligase